MIHIAQSFGYALAGYGVASISIAGAVFLLSGFIKEETNEKLGTPQAVLIEDALLSAAAAVFLSTIFVVAIFTFTGVGGYWQAHLTAASLIGAFIALLNIGVLARAEISSAFAAVRNELSQNAFTKILVPTLDKFAKKLGIDINKSQEKYGDKKK